jgi:hypothetical protein
VLSAHDRAGGWNDGSRLATVECLVDYGTLAIDRSIFVVPPRAERQNPYPPTNHVLERGTLDKLRVNGHFYSDKSPAPALLMAGVYQVWKCLTGLTAREAPGRFCYWMTVGTSGLAFVTAVWCIYQMCGLVGLSLGQQLGLTACFAFSTLALTYTRHVNNHILLLAVAAAVMLLIGRMTAGRTTEKLQILQLGALGSLAGLGYAIDLGAGPVLLLSTLGIVVYHFRNTRSALVFTASALPWLVLHHALNHAVGGTWKPANAVVEYLQWPGSPFNAGNMTGSWQHGTVWHFVVYSAALLAGKRGFLGHNLPLYLAIPGVTLLCRQKAAELPAIVFAVVWSIGTWLLYAGTSNNYSGVCCSIRWFVPLLAPGFYILAVTLRRSPSCWPELGILTVWGSLLSALMWRPGPWAEHMVPFFWPIQGLALASWLSWRAWQRGLEKRREQSSTAGVETFSKAA